jgi:hypothetical protein
MARRNEIRPRHVGVAGLAMLSVLLLIAVLVIGGWRSGLLTMKTTDLSMRLPERPVLPKRAPNPAPIPLPKPGPGVEQG